MIRFLILCVVFFLLYLGFSAITEYDSSLEVSLLGYQLETTMFTSAAVFIAAQLILMIALKFIFLVFDIPTLLKKKWHKRKLVKVNKRLLNSLAQLLMGNRQQSLKITNSLVSDLDDDNKDVANLLLSETETGFDKRISYLRNLIDKKHYSVYAAKELAKIFYQNNHHKQAEECALKGFNEDDTDTELMLILIRVYSSLNLWPKLVFIVSKLQRADVELLDKHSEEIAGYYYAAAKFYLQSGADSDAIKYLESALELKPDYVEALSLFVELSNNVGNTASTLKVLKAAFAAKPCFEIARMFADNSKSSEDVVYGMLAGIADPSKYPALFLAMAAYLGLIEKIKTIKEPKLITHDN